MQVLQDSLSHEYVVEELWSQGVAVLYSGQIQNLTDFLETISEERALMELTLSYAGERTEDVGVIEKVEVNEKMISLI